jgi:hypothetical protein
MLSTLEGRSPPSSSAVQEHIGTLVEKERHSQLTPDEAQELEQYEEPAPVVRAFYIEGSAILSLEIEASSIRSTETVVGVLVN